MDTLQAYGRAFRTIERDHGFERIEVEGTLPPDLSGTLWRNGPGQLEHFGRLYNHWFDADGAVTAVRFADGRAQMACRVVECPRLAEERAAGKQLYASGTTRVAWHRMVGGRGKAVRNINVLDWQGQMYALAEGALPIPIDRDGLGSAPPRALAESQASFHAHHRTDPRTGDVYGFGVAYGRKTHLDIYHLPRSGAGRRIARFPLSGMPVLVHDIAFAGDALVIMVHPISVRVLPLMLGLQTTLEALRWSPDQGTEVFVVPLTAPERARRFKVPAFFHFHFGNAFTDGDAVHVDLARMPQLDFAHAFTLAQMQRGQVPDLEPARLARMTLRGDRAEVVYLSPGEAEFPVTDPRVAGQRHRYTWAVGAAKHGQPLARYDHETDTWAPVPLGHHVFSGEATVIPRGAAEDDVWVLAHVFDGVRNRTGVAVVDGLQPEAPPVATAWFGHHVPPALHGCWVAA